MSRAMLWRGIYSLATVLWLSTALADRGDGRVVDLAIVGLCLWGLASVK